MHSWYNFTLGNQLPSNYTLHIHLIMWSTDFDQLVLVHTSIYTDGTYYSHTSGCSCNISFVTYFCCFKVFLKVPCKIFSLNPRTHWCECDAFQLIYSQRNFWTHICLFSLFPHNWLFPLNCGSDNSNALQHCFFQQYTYSNQSRMASDRGAQRQEAATGQVADINNECLLEHWKGVHGYEQYPNGWRLWATS